MSELVLREISHAFGTIQVLHAVSASVAEGELVCLLGPSGCGKTTLLRIAAGLEVIQEGNVTIAGERVGDGAAGHSLAPEQRGVGLMFQDFALFPHLNVADNIAFGLDKASRTARQDWLSRAAASMGIEPHLTSYPHMLSGGQQQRVALLRALAPEPRVLLLDEPFSGLDVTRRAQIRSETLAVIKETGVATLMVTHDPEEAMFMADRILVMNEGRVIQDGPPADLYFKPCNAFVAELFGTINRFQGQVFEGGVETPLGWFSTNGLSAGTHVDVYVRPEAIEFISPSEENVPVGRVRMARTLGRASVLQIELGEKTLIEARTSGILLPDAGIEFGLRVDPRLVHIFS
jgi:iron(III) transport system ATP-binding protein